MKAEKAELRRKLCPVDERACPLDGRLLDLSQGPLFQQYNALSFINLSVLLRLVCAYRYCVIFEVSKMFGGCFFVVVFCCLGGGEYFFYFAQYHLFKRKVHYVKKCDSVIYL